MDNHTNVLVPQEEAPALTTLDELITYCVTRFIPLNQVAMTCRLLYHILPTLDEIMEVLTSIQRNYTCDELGNPRV